MRLGTRWVVALLLASSAAWAQVPPKLGYQGRLLKADGTPQTGAVAITFRLFSVPTGGTSLWAETQTLALTEGFYSTFLGDGTPAGCTGSSCTGVPSSVFDGTERYLEVQVGNTVLQPRQRLGSVAHAYRAEFASSANTATNLSGGTVNATSLTVNGNTIVNTSGQVVAAPAAHTHAASDITSGVLNVARIPQGSGSTLDADKLDGLDSTAFAAAAHTHSASDITSGVLNVARVPQGSGSTLDADKLDGLDSTAFLPSSAAIPSGTVVMFLGTTAPAGWVIADGRTASRTGASGLFALIGTAYGAGDGSTTFNVPDLRGRMPVAVGVMAQVASVGLNDGLLPQNREVSHNHSKGTLNIANGGSHSHGASGAARVAIPGYPAGPDGALAEMGDLSQPNQVSGQVSVTVNSSTHAHPSSEFSGVVGDTAGPLNGPAYFVLNFIIKM